MKKKLLLFFITAFSFGQIPTDYLSAYLFTSGSLANSTTNNLNLLTLIAGNNYSFDQGIGGEINSSLDGNNSAWSFTDCGGQGEASISFWVKNPRGLLLQQSNFLFQLNNSFQINLSGYIRRGTINQQYINLTGATSLNDGAWHHILYTSYYNSGGSLITNVYIDGNLEINSTNGSYGDEYFFNGWESTFLNFNGDTYSDFKFDNYRFYTRELSSSEIAALANENISLSNNDFNIEDEFKVYPNPVQNELNIQSNFGIRNVEIYSLDGKLMLQSNAKIINVHSLETGIYILKITGLDGQNKVKKIIKK